MLVAQVVPGFGQGRVELDGAAVGIARRGNAAGARQCDAMPVAERGVGSFERHGLRVEVLRASPLAAEFAKVRTRIHPHFSRYDEDALATAFGVLFITPAPPPSF